MNKVLTVRIPFNKDFDVPYGVVEQVAPGIRRITANNPGPFTFRGTGTYILGEGKVAVIAKIDGIITPVTERHVKNIIDDAEDKRAELVVILLIELA